MAIDTLPGPRPDSPAAPDSADTTFAQPARRAEPSDDRRRMLARAMVAVMARALPEDGRLSVGLDGDAPPDRGVERSNAPDQDGAVATRPARTRPRRAHVRILGPDAVVRLLPPTENAFADGYLRGDLEIDCDVAIAIEAARGIDLRRLSPADARRLARWGLELRRNRVVAPPLQRMARLTGPRHSRARDLEAIRFHYDVGDAFFGLWLDRRLAYSCAWFERDTDPAADLDAAQEAKLDLICRKLDLRPGQRLLDIGCGWGSLVLFAAERYGVEAVGVTLSEPQAAETNRRAAQLGLGDRARAEVRDYRDLAPLGPFEAVASVGMFEHVGAANLPMYFAAARDALAPGGRFLNHGIASAATGPRPRAALPRTGFMDRYVFPDGELVPVERAIEVARAGAGFELLDVQLLRPHYALTLEAWVERLERSWDTAVALVGQEVARTWRLYMSASRVGFEQGELDVAQLLLAKPGEDGRPAPRPLRPWW
jgi:cyclopropane-fatty-acyl-phospholipid synthase